MAARNKHRHPLLVQAPLIVSPSVVLPSGRDLLPFDFKPTPTALPSTILDDAPPPVPPSQPVGSTPSPSDPPARPKYVRVHDRSFHPSDIIDICNALMAEEARAEDAAVRDLEQWRAEVESRELAEKRRIAPGWLDSDQRVLVPENVRARSSETGQVTETETGEDGLRGRADASASRNHTFAAAGNELADLAEQLDLAFGSGKAG